jgi:hypothetical protein
MYWLTSLGWIAHLPLASFSPPHHSSSLTFPLRTYCSLFSSTREISARALGLSASLDGVISGVPRLFASHNLSCRVERLVKLSTSDRVKPDASSSKPQSFDVDQAKRAYDPKPGETLRHERATRRGLPRRGATSGAYMFHLVV